MGSLAWLSLARFGGIFSEAIFSLITYQSPFWGPGSSINLHYYLRHSHARNCLLQKRFLLLALDYAWRGYFVILFSLFG